MKELKLKTEEVKQEKEVKKEEQYVRAKCILSNYQFDSCILPCTEEELRIEEGEEWEEFQSFTETEYSSNPDIQWLYIIQKMIQNGYYKHDGEVTIYFNFIDTDEHYSHYEIGFNREESECWVSTKNNNCSPLDEIGSFDYDENMQPEEVYEKICDMIYKFELTEKE